MKAPLKSIAWLLPLLLAGCIHHKAQQAQNQPLAPPVVNTPPPTAAPAPTEQPAPVVVAQQAEKQPEVTPPPKVEPKPVKRPARHPKKEPAKTTEQAANTPASGPEVSAIGQLSTGDSSDQRSQTEQSIAAVDQGLKKLTRPLDNQEQKTAAQIREFLKQARAALSAGDVDGAHTLAVKAKVLLGELTK